MIRAAFVFAFCLISLMAASVAYADVVTVSDADNQGYWTDFSSVSGTYQHAQDNYFTGTLTPNPVEHRGYFTFDLSGISSDVESAVLQIRLGQNESPNSVDTLGIFDVSTDSETLSSGDQSIVGAAVFNDLGSGNMYASSDVAIGSPEDTILQIPLNEIAISDINAHLGTSFSVGARLMTLGSINSNQFLFGSSDGFANNLVLTTVPEPSSLILCTLGVVGLLASRRAVRIKSLALILLAIVFLVPASAIADTARIILDDATSYTYFAQGHTDVTFDTAQGDSISANTYASLPDNDPTFVVFWLNFPSTVDDYLKSYQIAFGTNALPNTALVPGTYLDAERAFFADPGHPGLDLIRQTTGSNEEFGSFTITQSTFSNGQVTSFAADFVLHSEQPTSPEIDGQFFFNVVPEPSTLILAACGVIGLLPARRRLFHR